MSHLTSPSVSAVLLATCLALAGHPQSLLSFCRADSLLAVLDGNPDFSLLKKIIDQSGVRDQIASSTLEATTFAPNNAAFQRLMQDLSLTQEALLASPYLEKILKYHVVPGFALKVGELSDGDTYTTLLDDNSQILTIDKHSQPGRVVVIGYNRTGTVIQPDVQAAQQVAHVIDNVLLPKT